MNKEIYQILVKTAKKGNIITYNELAALANFEVDNIQGYKKLGLELLEIDHKEYKTKRILLSAVVVRKNIEVPGNGFFSNAIRLGLNIGKNKVVFYVDELRKVYKTYNKYK